MIIKKQDQRFHGSAAAHVMMLAAAISAVSLGAAAHGEEPGDEAADIPSLEHAGLLTEPFAFVPGVPQQTTSIFQPSRTMILSGHFP